MTAIRKLRCGLLAGLAALAVGWMTPAIDHASAKPKGGGSAVTCDGGASPGDIQTVHSYIYVNGNLVAKTTVRQICGKDGKWHEIGEIVAANGVTASATTTITPTR